MPAADGIGPKVAEPRVPASFSFRCNACGRCCNSPPAMTIAELFRHEHLFVGCLAVRRDADGTIALATQGHDYPTLGACAALDRASGLCTIHGDDLPGQCRVVPLEPRLPDGAQRLVLHRRRAEAEWLGADCIAAGARAGHAPLVADDVVVDAGYREAIVRHRERLAAEHAGWGRTVLEALRPALAPGAPAPGGYLALSLVPVLGVLARASQEARARCVHYAASQRALIARKVDLAVQRRDPRDRAFTGELRRFAGQYAAFAAAARGP